MRFFPQFDFFFQSYLVQKPRQWLSLTPEQLVSELNQFTANSRDLDKKDKKANVASVDSSARGGSGPSGRGGSGGRSFGVVLVPVGGVVLVVLVLVPVALRRQVRAFLFLTAVVALL